MLLAMAMCTVAAAQHTALKSKKPGPPSFCKPCLWFSGDFNVDNSKANGLTNEIDLSVSGSAVSVPFRVPRGKRWKVTGAFGIVISETNAIDPAQADWSFSKGVSGGNAGKLIASGTSPATANVLNCTNGVDFFCLGILVKGLHVTLKAGKYWLTVVPYCTNQNDCESARYFLADEEDDPKPLNHVGPKNILDASYVTAKDFGLFYTPTWGASGACGALGCDMFSAGVLGKSMADGAELESQ
jgi:hypothetical protein